MSHPTLNAASRGIGKPLVLLHAFPLSHEMWIHLKAPTGFRLILPDFPGFGLSPQGPMDFTLEDAARVLRELLNREGVQGPLVLGGISMGGYWAMEFLRLYPDLVSSLLLISTRSGTDSEGARQNRLKMAEEVLAEGTASLARAMIPGLLGATTRARNPAVAEEVTEFIRKTSPEAVAGAQKAMAGRRDQGGTLAQSRTPTLIMAGLEDSLIPESESQALAEKMRQSRLERIEQTGHLIPLEAPERFQFLLDDFLSQRI